MSGNLQGVLGVLVLIADIWAIVNIGQSDATTGRKVLWMALVIIFPLGGVIIWFLAGPRGR